MFEAMKPAAQYKLVLVTAPDMKTARRIAQAALRSRLIACANLVPGIESHYRWEGRLQRGAEVLMILKAAAARLAELERLVLARHPYDTPEVLALPLESGSGRYLAWLKQCCAGR